MAAPSDSATSAVLQALHTLYSDPDTSSKRAANDWLQDFQHSVDAWQTCHSLLTAPDSPLEGRLFAAQTFRAKVLYDFQQLPEEQRFPLRDSLLSALPPLTQPSAPTGSRAVLIQLCLAISALGLQTPSWQNPVGDMIERFGKDPSTVVILLSFLKSWAEESTNSRIAIVDGDTRIGGAVDQVMGVLTMYIQAPGITLQIQTAVFETLRSWLQSGEVMATQVANTPLFPAAFEALSSDQLFDAAVDVLCDLIHETQEIQDNVEVINQIIPRVIALRPQFEAQKEDADAVRGFCRIFCEAGECYHELIARHPSDLLPLVEAVATCAAYPDLDIVPITFNFWYTLATSLGRQPQDPSFRPLLAIFENLQITMINHLHFPSDDESQSAQERDEFRTFRHRMGDTLKDCCHVLGSTTCLRKSYEIITAALSKPSPSWQEIEAPLFSMRSMGAEVDPNDDEVLPHIMDMLPKLPEHPRIRYAAILVLSRYTQWIDRHPENLAFQLQYISAGFEMAQEEVSAAAAQAMKWMCQDCNQHLVPYLPQLHTFVNTMGDKLGREDILEVCEAIGYVIASMPAADAAPALQSFCEPLIQIAQAVADSPSEASKPDLQKVADALEQVDAFLSIVRTLDPLPEACYSTAVSVYSVLDQLLAKYASRYFISERVGTILRRGLAFFPSRALEPLLQPLLSRMSSAFDETGYASYVWITGKTAARFGPDASGPGGEAVGGLLGTAFEGISNGLGRLLQTKISLEIPDVMDDYVHCFNAYLTHLPAYTLSSPTLPLAFSHTLMALTCPAPEAILVSLDVLHLLSQRLSHTQFQPTLQPLFAQYGQALVGVILPGIVGQFPEDGLDQAQGVLGATVMCAAPEEVERWAGEGLAATPSNVLPAHDKEVFMRELHEHLVMPGTDRLKNAIINVVRAARRTRERRGQTRKSLGAGM